MPKNKDLKRLARERSEKTGESYTAARSQLIKKRNPPEDEYAKLGGMSDDALRAKTGKTWKEWVSALDAVSATSKPHREIARHVNESYDEVSPWWAQTIAGGYERIRGLREPGQQRGGSFEVSKSKTIKVPVEALYAAFVGEERRALWLGDTKLEVRTANADKSIRARLGNGTAIDAYFTAKGEAKSSVSLQLRGLPDKQAADEARAFWTERLSLAALLTANGEDP